MIRAALPVLLLVLAAPVSGQEAPEPADGPTEQSAPFKEAGGLAARIDPAMLETEYFTAVARPDVTAAMLDRARVLDIAGERTGAVSGLVYDASGAITDVVITFGGVLGLGDKRVAIPIDDLAVSHSETLNETRIILPHSRSELRDMTPFDG